VRQPSATRAQRAERRQQQQQVHRLELVDVRPKTSFIVSSAESVDEHALAPCQTGGSRLGQKENEPGMTVLAAARTEQQ